MRIFVKDKILSSPVAVTSFWLLEGSDGQLTKFCWAWIGWRRSLAKTSLVIGLARKSTVLVFLLLFFYVDLYIFLDLWVWFPRGFNVDCFGIFCAEIDFEWVSQLGLSWFGEEHEEWSSGLEVSRFDIFLGWRFDDFSGLVFSCGFGFDDFFMFWRFQWTIGILYEILHCFGFDVLLFWVQLFLDSGKTWRTSSCVLT